MDKKAVFAFVSIMALGTALRFYGLTNQSLWHDESGNWQRSGYGSLSEVIVKGARHDVHPPAYLILLHYFRKIAGDSEAALRFPSVIFGISTIPLIFLIGCQLYSRREALIASSLFAVLWMPLFYSQDATSYAMLLFLACLATFFWIDLIQKLANGLEPSWWVYAGYVLSAVSCSYTHYFGLFLICLQGIGAFLLAGRKRHSFVFVSIVYILIFILYLPWFDAVIGDLSRSTFHRERPNFSDIAYFFSCLFNKSGSLTILFFLFNILAFLKFIRRRGFAGRSPGGSFSISSSAFLVLWLFLPLTITYVKSLISLPVLNPRYLIISAPAAYLLFARSITILFSRWKARGAVTILLTGLILWDLIFGVHYYSKPHKEQTREVVQALVAHERFSSDGLIVACAYGGRGHQTFNYYLGKFGSVRRVDLPVGAAKRYTSRVSSMIEARDPEYLWLLVGLRKPEEEFMHYLHQNYKLVEHQAFYRADLWLFKK